MLQEKIKLSSNTKTKRTKRRNPHPQVTRMDELSLLPWTLTDSFHCLVLGREMFYSLFVGIEVPGRRSMA